MIPRSHLPLFLSFAALSPAAATPLTGVEHVVVLMLENRAFDHMLGALQKEMKEVRGCIDPKTCSNPVDPLNPDSEVISMTYNAVYQIASPCHEIHCVTQQIFGAESASIEPVLMNGFIANFEKETKNDTYSLSVMDAFSPDHIPAIYSLAKEYAVYDAWYSAVPGPTMVNRAFAASATSHGMGTNDPITIALGLPQKTMFKQLEEMGLDWRVYFQDIPSVLQHRDMRRLKTLNKFKRFSKFYDDVGKGKLPAFTWLEPAYFDGPLQPASDQHPDHDVSVGDQLIKDVYEALRSSPAWNKTALVITYDEHGGFYDHVVPPDAPSPDGLNSTGKAEDGGDGAFSFDRIGVRVPTIIVSPLIPKGTVVHEPTEGEGQFEHSSIISTVVHKLFEAAEGKEKPEYLTARDEWAGTFEDVFSLSEPRTDCISTLPVIESHRKQFPHTLPPLDGMMEISELQEELLQLARELDLHSDCEMEEEGTLGKAILTEKDGLEYMQQRMDACGIGLDGARYDSGK